MEMSSSFRNKSKMVWLILIFNGIAFVMLMLAGGLTDPDVLIRVSENLGEAMVGIDIKTLDEGQLLQNRGW